MPGGKLPVPSKAGSAEAVNRVLRTTWPKSVTHLEVSTSHRTQCVNSCLCQFLQQRLGLLEVGGVKAFGEPAVDWRQQGMRFGAHALLLPEATEAHGGP